LRLLQANTARLLLVLGSLPLLVHALSSCAPSSEAARRPVPLPRASLDKVDRIRSELEHTSRFSDADRQYLERRVSSGQFVLGMQCALTLCIATHKHVYPVGALYRTLRAAEVTAPSREAIAYLQCAEDAVVGAFGPPLDATKAEYDRLLLDKQDSRNLANSEKQFLKRALAGNQEGDKVLGAELLVSKQSIPDQDLEWALALVLRDRDSAPPRLRAFWGFVAEVVHDRSASGVRVPTQSGP